MRKKIPREHFQPSVCILKTKHRYEVWEIRKSAGREASPGRVRNLTGGECRAAWFPLLPGQAQLSSPLSLSGSTGGFLWLRLWKQTARPHPCCSGLPEGTGSSVTSLMGRWVPHCLGLHFKIKAEDRALTKIGFPSADHLCQGHIFPSKLTY